MTGSKSLRFYHEVKGYFNAPFIQKDLGKPSRVQTFLFCTLLILTTFLSVRNYDSFQIGTYMDDASYVVLARSLVFGKSYGLINFPGESQSTRYPFGFPLLLSPLVLLFPQTFNTLKLISLFATLANDALLFFGWPFLCRNKSHWWSLSITALYSLSPLVIGHTRMVMSEPAFTTFTLLSLILVEKYLSEDGAKRPLYVFLVGAAAFFTLFIRTVGIALVIAIGIRVTLLPMQWTSKIRWLAWFVIGGITLVFVILITTPVTVKSLVPVEYVDQFDHPQLWGQVRIEDALLPRLIGALRDYASQHLREAVIPIGGGHRELELGRRLGIPNLPLLTGLMIGSLMLLGMLVFQEQGLFPSALIFAMLYFGAILVWPWRGARFLYPIQPFLFYYLLEGIRLIAKPFNTAKLKIFDSAYSLINLGTGVCCFILLCLSLYKGITDNGNSLQYVRDFQVGTVWLRENSPSDAVIMAQQPQSVYLYSDRKTVDYARIADSSQLKDAIQRQNIDYILVAPKLEWRQDGLLVYDAYTQETFLPSINQLEAQRELYLIYESEKDMVKLYQVANRD